MFVSHVLLVRILVLGVDERSVNCFSSCVSSEAAWTRALLVLRKPDMVELCRKAFFWDFLREDVRLNVPGWLRCTIGAKRKPTKRYSLVKEF